jgi:hypothetical protein
MSKLKRIQAKASELARSGEFYGWRPIEFELFFEDGISEAREWLYATATQEELDRICQKARMRRLTSSAPRKPPLAG